MIIQGQIESSDKSSALHELKKQGLLPTDVTLYESNHRDIFQFSKQVTLAELEFLTAELSLLLDSGVRIDKGIDIIKRTKAKPALASLLTDISHDLKKGKTLAEAFGNHSETFDPLYCNLIEIGEASGSLAEIFRGLAQDLKFKRDLQRKIVSSLAYPIVILLVCILSIVFIFNFIIPKMSTMFNGITDLPWYTSAMLSTSAWMIGNQSLLLVGIVLFVIGIFWALKQPSVIQKWQEISLQIPILKTAIVTVERIRFNNGLALMLKAGVPIDKAISLSTGNIKNLVLKRQMEIAKKKVKNGSTLTPALRQTALYPDFFVSLLEVGEESGNLEKVFEEIANRSRQEFESWTDRITTLIEPIMILVMGGFVGGIVVMMLLSMVSINEIGF
jgi:type II secretory pathway component PulF